MMAMDLAGDPTLATMGTPEELHRHLDEQREETERSAMRKIIKEQIKHDEDAERYHSRAMSHSEYKLGCVSNLLYALYHQNESRRCREEYRSLFG